MHDSPQGSRLTSPPSWAITNPDDVAFVKQFPECWDQEEAERIVRFAEKYIRPRYIRGEFRLLDWQKQWLMRIYGFRRPDRPYADGSFARRAKTVILFVPRKNGKTLLVAILVAYELYYNRNPNPLIFSASTDSESAAQIFAEIDFQIQNNELLAKNSKVNRGKGQQKIVITRKKKRNGRTINETSEYAPKSSDAAGKLGHNLCVCVLDEVAWWPGRDLWDNVQYSLDAREDALTVAITTAGKDQSHFFFTDVYQKCKNIKAGSLSDFSWQVDLYENDGDPSDPATWAATNPSLGTSFTVETMAEQWQAAKENPADKLNFLCFKLNRWVSASAEPFVDLQLWDSLKAPVPEDLSSYPCVAAFDLSKTTDPTVCGLCHVLPGNRFYFQQHAWVCAGGVTKREKSLLPSYRVHQEAGYLTITPGDYNDETVVETWIVENAKRYRIVEIVIDDFNAGTLTTGLVKAGFTVTNFGSSAKWFHEPIKSFSLALGQRRLAHDGNTMLRWALQNVTLDFNREGHCRIDKGRSRDKVDCAQVAVMSYAKASALAVNKLIRPSVYDTKPMLIV